MTTAPYRTFQVDRLHVRVYPDRDAMGRAAAQLAADHIRAFAGSQADIRMVFAAAQSQNEFLKALVDLEDLPWQRVTAFHMDEYLNLPAGASQLFGRFLRRRLFDLAPINRIHFIDPDPHDVQAECDRYAALLEEAPIDITCLGIGENGHLAFNDPPVADFDDPTRVKVVALDAVSRQQQVNDDAFQSVEDVPTHAVTLTIPALMAARRCIVVVPGGAKASAVAAALEGAVETSCPASVLRRHSFATLFLDAAAAANLAEHHMQV